MTRPSWMPFVSMAPAPFQTTDQATAYRESLAAALEIIRRQRCGYSSPINPDATCDCKYGLGDQIFQVNGRRVTSEQTGCPELRDAIRVILEGS